MLSIYPNARTTPAVRAEIARSSEPTSALERPDRAFGPRTEHAEIVGIAAVARSREPKLEVANGFAARAGP